MGRREDWSVGDVMEYFGRWIEDEGEAERFMR